MKKFEIKWCNKEVVVGKGQKVLVNQLVGINDVTEYNDCIAKIDMWDKENEGPDIIMDVSLFCTDSYSIWKYALEKRKYIVGTVPIYFVKEKEHIRKEELLAVIRDQLCKGVKIITIHPTPTYELIEMSRKRITPFTSRGGGIVIKDLLNNKKQKNIYMECLDDIISLCLEYRAAISIGTSFRSANIIDSMDEVQKLEIKSQIQLAEYIESKKVNVIVEMPGHASPSKIEELNKMINNQHYPIMPLGPVVTDIGAGMDHITSAIGLVLMGLKGNVQIISAVTAEEHTGDIPSIKATYEAVKTARLVAHIIDMEQLNDLSKDYAYAVLRKNSCVLNNRTRDCLRCGDYCPLKVK